MPFDDEALEDANSGKKLDNLLGELDWDPNSSRSQRLYPQTTCLNFKELFC